MKAVRVQNIVYNEDESFHMKSSHSKYICTCMFLIVMIVLHATV